MSIQVTSQSVKERNPGPQTELLNFGELPESPIKLEQSFRSVLAEGTVGQVEVGQLSGQ